MMLLVERGRYDTHSDIVNPYGVFFTIYAHFYCFSLFLEFKQSKKQNTYSNLFSDVSDQQCDFTVAKS